MKKITTMAALLCVLPAAWAAGEGPADHPLIVHLAEAAAADQWAQLIPPFARDLMRAFWPGPLTLILKKQAWVPSTVTGGQDTVGLRVPGHPVALELLRCFATAVGGPAGIAARRADRAATGDQCSSHGAAG